MACGCAESGCTCVLQGAGTVVVSGAGTVANPYIISSSASPLFAATNPGGGILITPGGTLGHTPAFDLVIDPASTAPVSVSEDGLRVDCCPPGPVVSPVDIVDEDTLLTDDMQVVLADTSLIGIELTLPATPTEGQRYEIGYYLLNFANNITLEGNGNTIGDGIATSYLVVSAAITLIWDGVSNWATFYAS